jgi:uncharacterized membrane protein YphA (DoxX/SURF4 family)
MNALRCNRHLLAALTGMVLGAAFLFLTSTGEYLTFHHPEGGKSIFTRNRSELNVVMSVVVLWVVAIGGWRLSSSGQVQLRWMLFRRRSELTYPLRLFLCG